MSCLETSESFDALEFFFTLLLSWALQHDCNTSSCLWQMHVWQDQFRLEISCSLMPRQSAWKSLWQPWHVNRFSTLPPKQTQHISFAWCSAGASGLRKSRRIQNFSWLQTKASRFNLAAIVPRISIAMVRAETSLDFGPAFWSSRTQRTWNNSQR